MGLIARSGHIKLDFTEAVITQPTLHIDAEVRSGHIVMITRPPPQEAVTSIAKRSLQT